tara:strand:- start:116 stop:628 length:513 start_codon:yes stop_codon:yes gene_type:complete
MENLTHWRKLVNTAYLGAYSLMDGDTPKDLTVKIVKVVREQVKGEAGKSEECTVAYLENQKPIILNRTNCKAITSLYGSPYIERWVGLSITLFVSETSVKGVKTDCLRIRPIKPQVQQPITANVDNEVAQIKACNTLEELQKVYMAFTAQIKAEPLVLAAKDAMKVKLTT